MMREILHITKSQDGKGNSMEKKEVVYLVLTDAVNSCKLDKELKPIQWRQFTFKNQLKCLLSSKSIPSLALKSVGDALFVIYKPKGNESKENEIVKEILYGVWNAFESTRNDKNNEVPIRCAIHRIIDHEKGDKIASHLESSLKETSGNKTHLIEALKEDIFGKEVNRAARILSLVHNPAILVSEDIVNIIDQNANDKDLDSQIIKFEHNNESLIFHSPVPVLYMKGVFDLDEIKVNKKPYVVWELGKNEEPTLMPEFKCHQALRLITVRLKGPQKLSEEIKNITKDTLENLSLLKPDIKLKFYIDMLWKIEDYFIIRAPSIERIRREGTIVADNYLKSLENLFSTKETEGNIRKDGQVRQLIINANRERIEEITYGNPVPNKEFLIPLLAFTTFPDFEHLTRTRSLLSREELSNSSITEIKPESIEIFGNIKIDNNLINKKGKNILLLFQVFSSDIEEAENLKELFKNVKVIEDHQFRVVCYGLTRGFTDGFVLYTCQSEQDNWNEGLKSILSKVIGDTKAKSFYHKIYPIAVFILEQVSEFPSLERNIQCLKQAI